METTIVYGLRFKVYVGFSPAAIRLARIFIDSNTKKQSDEEGTHLILP